MTEIKTITAEELKQRGAQNGIILDVRTPMEHGEKRLVCAHAHVPLDQLDPARFMQEQGRGAETPVYILCRSGGRARVAAEKFAAAGYGQVFVVTGGITACAECGHDVEGTQVQTVAASAVGGGQEAGPAGLSLERQVRVAAGGIAAIGALLGLTVSDIFTVIPLAVGCGLVYAGLTDKCGMALLLTKAPWNNPQGTCCRPSCCSTDGKGGGA